MEFPSSARRCDSYSRHKGSLTKGFVEIGITSRCAGVSGHDSQKVFASPRRLLYLDLIKKVNPLKQHLRFIFASFLVLCLMNSQALMAWLVRRAGGRDEVRSSWGWK